MDSAEKSALHIYFDLQREDEDIPYAIAAMKALMESSRKDESTTTMQEFIAKMGEARKVLQSTTSNVAVRSGCELFVRFITFSQRELEQAAEFKLCRNILLARGQNFIEKMQKCRDKVVESSKNLIKDEMVILTHSKSRNVLAAMKKAAENGRQFTVYITEAQPRCDGLRMAKDLKEYGINCVVILDSAVSYIIEKVNVILVGAEGVCENGGIINRIGTCNMATLAHLKNKPVYVLVESFKFIRLMPLNNSSLPKEYLFSSEALSSGRNLEDEHPLVDYTPPTYLTLLYTDLGILPTSAVTEHLIKLYT